MGLLILSPSVSGATVNLTAVGSTDWAVWNANGVVSPSSTKSGGGSTISLSTADTLGSYTNDPRTITWSNGTPTGSGSETGGNFDSATGGLTFSLPASTVVQRAYLYLGGFNATTTSLVASLSDGSAATQTYLGFTAGATSQDYVVAIDYQANSSGQTLSVVWKFLTGSGNVTFQAVAIQPGHLGGSAGTGGILLRRGMRLGTPISRLRGIYDDTVLSGTITINALIGAYVWEGTTSTASGLINAGIGAYSWAGTTAATSELINAEIGAYNWIGTTSTASGLINAGIGSYTWSGTTSSASELILAVPGTYTWAGTTATASGLIQAAIGTYTWSGTTGTLGGPINAIAGAYTWSASTSILSQLINGIPGAYTWSESVDSTVTQLIVAIPAAFAWAGTTATFSQVLSALTGAYTWSATTASLGAGAIQAIVGAYTWIGVAAQVPTQISSDPTFGYVWSGIASTFGSQQPPVFGSNAPTLGGGGGDPDYRSNWSAKHKFKGDIDAEIAKEWRRIWHGEAGEEPKPAIINAPRPLLTRKGLEKPIETKPLDEDDDEMALLMIEQAEREQLLSVFTLLRRGH